jgi:catechol 2,3-dioxygenase-like lactoylglutathione lyase family enzyme
VVDLAGDTVRWRRWREPCDEGCAHFNWRHACSGVTTSSHRTHARDDELKETGMLEAKDAIATVPTRNLAAAAKFYEGMLGLSRVGPDRHGVILYRTGQSNMLVYESQYAGTNQATTVTWVGLDVDAVVRDLKAKSIRFEHYEMPDTKLDGDVHVSDGMRTAWFKDPDGNIHALAN